MVAFTNPLRLAVLRLGWTEPAWTSPLNYGKRDGDFECAGCGQRLFTGTAKFDSGTGWPSFWRTAAPGLVAYNAPDFLGRVECHCAGCGGHLGHCFDDGPLPQDVQHTTGDVPPDDLKCDDGRLPRYCINGLALRYRAVR